METSAKLFLVFAAAGQVRLPRGVRRDSTTASTLQREHDLAALQALEPSVREVLSTQGGEFADMDYLHPKSGGDAFWQVSVSPETAQKLANLPGVSHVREAYADTPVLTAER